MSPLFNRDILTSLAQRGHPAPHSMLSSTLYPLSYGIPHELTVAARTPLNRDNFSDDIGMIGLHEFCHPSESFFSGFSKKYDLGVFNNLTLPLLAYLRLTFNTPAQGVTFKAMS
jgi:hypothetical protein